MPADSVYGLSVQQSELRFMFAQHSAGVDLELGRNGPPNVVEAARRYRRAAVLGFPLAQNNLGRLYEQGRGVTQDFTTAYVWYALAAARGDDMARVNRDRLMRRLTPDQLATGQRRTRALARHLP